VLALALTATALVLWPFSAVWVPGVAVGADLLLAGTWCVLAAMGRA